MLPCVSSVIDHRSRQNAIASCATFLFLPHFDVICDQLLNRRTETWNLFVKYTHEWTCGRTRKAVYTKGLETEGITWKLL